MGGGEFRLRTLYAHIKDWMLMIDRGIPNKFIFYLFRIIGCSSFMDSCLDRQYFLRQPTENLLCYLEQELANCPLIVITIVFTFW